MSIKKTFYNIKIPVCKDKKPLKCSNFLASQINEFLQLPYLKTLSWFELFGKVILIKLISKKLWEFFEKNESDFNKKFEFLVVL